MMTPRYCRSCHCLVSLEGRQFCLSCEPEFSKLGSVIACFGLITWFALAGLWEHYSYTKPTVRNPALGRVYSLANHGTVVYLNRQELQLLHVVEGLAFVGIVTFLVICAKYQYRAKKSPLQPK